MKAITSIGLVLLLNVVFTTQVQSQTQITTVEELAAINNDDISLKGRYKLMNDLTVENWTPIGSSVKPFMGTFDGGGHTIMVVSIGNVVSSQFNMKSGVKIPAIQTSYIGVFGYNGRRSVIKNLRIDGEVIYKSDKNENIIIGGVTGANYGTVNNCASVAEVKVKGSSNTGFYFVGGVIGINNGYNRNCYSASNVIVEGGAVNYAGGIAGLNDFNVGIIQWCYSAADISVNSGAEQYAGGIAGLFARGGLVQYCVALNENILSDKSENSYTGRYAGKNLGRAVSNFSRKDIVLTEDKADPNGKDLYETLFLKNIQWWTVNRYIRFAFGSNDTRPWAWSDEAKRPVMHWEQGATAASEMVTSRNQTTGIPSEEDLEFIDASRQVLTKFSKRSKYGLRDKLGNIIVPAKYDFIGAFSKEGLAQMSFNGKYGLIDKNGKEVFPAMYDEIKKISENGFAEVRLNGKRGILDKNGKEVIPTIYDEIGEFSDEGFVKVRLNSKRGILDKNGKEVIPLIYNQIFNFREGMAIVLLDGKFGYVDNTGNLVVPLLYDNVENFDEGMAKVRVNNKYGYINKSGTEIIPIKYELIDYWVNDKAKVCVEGKCGEINKRGEMVTSLRYKNEEMKIIWENLLLSYYNQIAEYRNTCGKSGTSEDFIIERPYLAITDNNLKYTDFDMLSSSEKTFTEKSMKDLKTLIIQFYYEDHSKSYGRTRNSASIANVTSYGSYLIYFDVSNKKIIGYDALKGPGLPETISLSSPIGMANHKDIIIEKIESRLSDFQQASNIDN
jgi:hypothetical protein